MKELEPEILLGLTRSRPAEETNENSHRSRLPCGALIISKSQWGFFGKKERWLGVLVFSALSGAAMASTRMAADFNGDGFGDLAIGAPGESVGAQGLAGAVNIVYGSGSGLVEEGNQIWTQSAPGVESLQTLGDSETGDRFGSSLAVGDFNGDGFTDLAVGVPYEDVGKIVNAGAVNIIYGGGGGLKVAQDQIWTQAAPGNPSLQLPWDARGNVFFGEALAAGDFNGDGRDDLAIGTPFEDSARGAVYVLYGAAGGLGFNPQRWTLNIPGVPGTGDILDRFGAALAAGDFNGDGRDDLAVGVPGDMAGSRVGAGAVVVLAGASGGLMAWQTSAGRRDGRMCGAWRKKERDLAPRSRWGISTVTRLTTLRSVFPTRRWGTGHPQGRLTYCMGGFAKGCAPVATRFGLKPRWE